MKITKRKDGRYMAQVPVGNGKRQSVYGKTKKEVKEKMIELSLQVKQGTYAEPSKMTVRQWSEQWLSDFCADTTQSTLTVYKSYLRKWINPLLGDIRLQFLKALDIQRLVAEMARSGVSDRYRLLVVSTLKKMLSDAVKAGLLSVSPADKVNRPKVKQKKMLVLEESELAPFLEAARGSTRFPEVYEFILLTGLRIGEALGLTFDRCDLARRSILVDRQLDSNGDSGFAPTKSKVSREVPLPERAAEIIEERWEKAKKGNGDIEDKDMKEDKSLLVFSRPGNIPITRPILRWDMKKAAKAIGKENLRVHDLRHTYATLSLKAGVDIKTLQENLGHATAGFTLQKYGHSTQEMKSQSAKKLESLVDSLKGNS